MKRMKKKILALITAVTMVFGMSLTAAAADETYSVTVSGKGANTYEAYQVFADITSDSDNVITDVNWGSGIETNYAQANSALTEATNLQSMTNGSDDVMAWARAISSHLSTTKVTYTGSDSATDATITGLTNGYYLIIDTNADSSSTTKYSLVQVNGSNVKITPKTEGVSFNKKLVDTNDSTGVTTDLQDGADYDIGDTVSYTLTGSLPDDYITTGNELNYSPYKYEFYDNMDAGLTFDATSVVVKYGDEVVTDYFTVDTTDGNYTFTVKCADITGFINAVNYDASKKLTVEFNATLNENAVTGTQGNWNTAYTVTSNGTTPEDKVVVFTYKVVVNKVDENNNALVGATFALYKKYATAPANGVALTFEQAYDAGLTTADETADNYVASYYMVSEIVGTDQSTFTWTGVDDGDYVIVETQTPNDEVYGYASPIAFSIVPTHDDNGDEPELTALSTTLTSASSTAELVSTLSDGAVTTTIQNRPTSTVLPSTGGIGTTIFYIIGGLLVVGAGVVLFTRKKMSTEE